MDEAKVRGLLQKMIEDYGRVIRDIETRNQERPDQRPIDVEWFRVVRAKTRLCLSALNQGDMDEFHALIEHIKAEKEKPPWPSLARELGLRPPEDWPSDEELGLPTRTGPQQTLIHCDEIEPGWLYVYADNPPSDPTRLPYMLNDAFGRWRKQNPNVNVRAALPIVAGGNTVAIHVFFDPVRSQGQR